MEIEFNSLWGIILAVVAVAIGVVGSNLKKWKSNRDAHRALEEYNKAREDIENSVSIVSERAKRSEKTAQEALGRARKGVEIADAIGPKADRLLQEAREARLRAEKHLDSLDDKKDV